MPQKIVKTAKLTISLTFLWLICCPHQLVANDDHVNSGKPKMLMVTQSAGFKHPPVKRGEELISPAEKTMKQIAQQTGLFDVDFSQDAATHVTRENLQNYDLVAFYTSGNLPIAKDDLKYLLEDWVKQPGHGFLGFHSASDTYKDHQPYWDFIGGTFDGHPWGANTKVTIKVHDPAHPAMKPFGTEFEFRDEIYQYVNWQPEKVRVLMSLDMEKTDLKRPYHVPVAWVKQIGEGRMFFNNLGHRNDTWENEQFQQSIVGAIRWIVGEEPGEVLPNPDVSQQQHEHSVKFSRAAGITMESLEAEKRVNQARQLANQAKKKAEAEKKKAKSENQLDKPKNAPRADKPLNVILIMADDSAADNYGCYGSTFFKTPTLDALAKAGAKFNHCYSEPVCTSSRVKIMTGRDGIRNYVAFGTLDKSETTFGTMMKKHGYATAVAGKWQLHGGKNGSLAPDCGFDKFCLWNYPGTERARYWNPSISRDGELVETTEKDYGPDIFTNYLIDFIEENKERPFFVYYPMVLVHSPFPVTPDSEPPTEEEKSKNGGETLKNFRDMTLYADKCVKRIVDCLDKNGLRENTVIIYTTDNGTGRGLTYPYRGEQRKGEKAYATDGGTHAPLIVNCPGVVPAGTVTDDLVDFSDVMPTLAEITSADLPDVELDGRSFWQQCLGNQGDPRQWIFQYYYPKFGPAAEKHGQGVNNREIVWAQNQYFKLYRDGDLFAVRDRYETKPIPLGTSGESDTARTMLQRALDSMPSNAAKLQAATQSP